MTRNEMKEGLRIVFVCVCWYVVSSSNGVLGKTILSQFPFPMTMTMVQLASIAICSPPLLKVLGVRSYESSGWSYHWKMLFPLAFAKFLSSVLAHVSIWKVPVSYAHTVKASMPIFTVVITRVVLGTRHATLTYLSLMPIVGGVAVATLSEVSFDLMGLLTALAATCGFAVITIFSKQALRDTGMHHLRLLHQLGLMASVMFFPVWLFADAVRVIPELTTEIGLLLILDGGLHWLQNILAFTLLKLVTSLTYAVANVTKRIAVISVSLLLLKNPVTWVNLGGMAMAILGVFCYNRAKHQENKASESLPVRVSSAPVKPTPIWQNHITFESKVRVTAPLHHFDTDLKRNQ